jgi:hypothetical protein
VTDVGDIGRMVRISQNGLVVEAEKSNQLAEAICKLMQLSTDDLKKMEDKSKEISLSHSWHEVANKLISFLIFEQGSFQCVT